MKQPFKKNEKMKRKIIIISQPTFYSTRKKNDKFLNPENDWFYMGKGKGHVIADYIKKTYRSLDVEIWRIDGQISERIQKKVNSIKGVVYPAKGGRNYFYPPSSKLNNGN